MRKYRAGLQLPVSAGICGQAGPENRMRTSGREHFVSEQFRLHEQCRMHRGTMFLPERFRAARINMCGHRRVSNKRRHLRRAIAVRQYARIVPLRVSKVSSLPRTDQVEPKFMKFLSLSVVSSDLRPASLARHRAKPSNAVRTLSAKRTASKRTACATRAGHTIRATSRPVASTSTSVMRSTVRPACAARMRFAQTRRAATRASVRRAFPETRPSNASMWTSAQNRTVADLAPIASTEPAPMNVFAPKDPFPIRIQVYDASLLSNARRTPIVRAMRCATTISAAYAPHRTSATIVGIRAKHIRADRTRIA